MTKRTIQSVLFERSKFTIPKAIKYLEKRNMKILKVDITKNYLRFRQEEPNKRNHYINVHGDIPGVHYIVMY